MVKQSFIPVRLQEDLDARIAAANGDVKQVRREVEAEINVAVAHATPDHIDNMVPLLRGELLYLDSLIHATDEAQTQHKPGFWQRLFKGNKPAMST